MPMDGDQGDLGLPSGAGSDNQTLETGPASGDLKLSVGRIGRAHGLRGDVVVQLSSQRGERLAAGALFETDRGPLTVAVSAPLPSGGWKVRFVGIDDRTTAEHLRGLELRAEPIELDGVVWVHDLIDASVIDEDGTVRGVVVAVEANPAHDLLVVADAGREHLVPMAFVTSIETGVVRIESPAGLFELN